MTNFDNPKNIVGMGDILADDDEDVDIDEIEKSVVSGIQTKPKEKTIDLAKEYSKELEDLGKKFNLDNKSKFTNITQFNNEDSRDIDDLLNLSNNSVGLSQKISNGSVPLNNSIPKLSLNANHSSAGPSSVNQYNTSHTNNGNYKPPYNLVDDDDSDDDDDENGVPTTYYPSNNARPAWDPNKPEDSQLNQMTNEERKQTHVNRVLQTMESNNDDAEFVKKEDEEDEMARIMEQIDLLKSNLESEGVDLSRIPDVNSGTSKKEAKAVLRILQIKNDRLRYCDFFEEGILAVAYGLEGVFNGQREMFGNRIDLTGYSDTVKVKLRRMRYDTSSFVSGVMQGYNISSGWRIVLELIPSLFLYSRDRRLKSKDTLISDESYKKAMQDLQ